MRQHHLLLLGAALVLGLGVYLFHEVRLSPAQAQASAAVVPEPRPDRPDKVEVKDAAVPEPEVKSKPPPPPHRRDPAVKPEPEVPPPSDPADAKANPKLDALMAEANKAYDHGEFDEAKQIALGVLQTAPGNVRMLRVMVSAWCQDSDGVEAQKYFAQLPVQDRAQMKIRCERNGVTFTDVPPPAK